MTLRIIPVNFFDQVAEADLTFTSEVAGLPAANLQSNVRDRVWRSTSDAVQVIAGNWDGEERPINAWGIWPGKLAGSTTKLILYSDVASTVPIFDSTDLPFPALSTSGWGDYGFGGEPWSAGAQTLAPRLDYLSQTYNAKSFTLGLGDVSLPQAYFEASRIWLGQYVDAPHAPRYGLSLGWKSESELRRSIGGTLRRLARPRFRVMNLDVEINTEADRYAWMDLLAASDPGNEIIVSAFPGDGTTRQERDHTIMGSLEVLNPIVFEKYNLHTLRLQVQES